MSEIHLIRMSCDYLCNVARQKSWKWRGTAYMQVFMNEKVRKKQKVQDYKCSSDSHNRKKGKNYRAINNHISVHFSRCFPTQNGSHTSICRGVPLQWQIQKHHSNNPSPPPPVGLNWKSQKCMYTFTWSNNWFYTDSKYNHSLPLFSFWCHLPFDSNY